MSCSLGVVYCQIFFDGHTMVGLFFDRNPLMMPLPEVTWKGSS